MKTTIADQLERFYLKVDRRGPDECWPWKGKLHDGYGASSANSRGIKAHRAHMILLGHDVAGLTVDHICRNRACVNPAHLRAVDIRTNSIENSVSIPAINASKTHCKRGHPLSGDNLRACKLRIGWRVCIRCRKDQLIAKRATIRKLAGEGE